MIYDIVGDVHGGFDPLRQLFRKLGYRLRNDYWHPPNGRQAIFVGDIVDRGREVRRCVRAVRRMVEEGHAQMVVGNHEWLLIRYTSKQHDGHWRVPHNRMVHSVLENTFRSYAGMTDQLWEDIRWLRQQPLWLEWPHFRVAHACWHDDDVSLLRQACPENCLSEAFMQKFDQWNPPLFDALERLLVGPKWTIPEGWAQPKIHYFRPGSLRYKWWLSPHRHTLAELDTMYLNLPDDHPLPAHLRPPDYSYPPNAKPLFIGHYCLTPPVSLLRPNLAPVDFCVLRNGVQTAYRFEGESVLQENHYVRGKQGFL